MLTVFPNYLKTFRTTKKKKRDISKDRNDSHLLKKISQL